MQLNCSFEAAEKNRLLSFFFFSYSRIRNTFDKTDTNDGRSRLVDILDFTRTALLVVCFSSLNSLASDITFPYVHVYWFWSYVCTFLVAAESFETDETFIYDVIDGRMVKIFGLVEILVYWRIAWQVENSLETRKRDLLNENIHFTNSTNFSTIYRIPTPNE